MQCTILHVFQTSSYHPSLPRDERSVIRQNLVKTIPVQAVFEREALRNRINLRLALTDEVFRPLANEELGDQDVAREASNAVRKFPDGRGIEALVFWLDLALNEVDERLVRRADVRFVCAPRIDCQPVLLRQEVAEQGHVRCLARDVDHALEADVFVQPDGPAESVLGSI